MVGRIQYEHEHNEMSFWNSNIKRMTLDGANVGIGITNPGATLHVVSGSDASIRIFDNTGAFYYHLFQGLMYRSFVEYIYYKREKELNLDKKKKF